MEILREFFGFGGYTREPEGWLSWQHLVLCCTALGIIIFLGVYLGRRMRTRDREDKLRVLKTAAILIDAFEIFKIVLLSFRSHDAADTILHNLPLFLCSIQLITIPLAAFSKGRIQEAALDFVFIFGMLGAVAGTFLAGNIFGGNPVLSFDALVSVTTHSISGFSSLYIIVSGLADMKKKNMWISFCILLFFEVTAYIVNKLIDYNYMFLERSDGTPFSICETITGGRPVLYALFVALLLQVYAALFYGVYFICTAGGKSGRKSCAE